MKMGWLLVEDWDAKAAHEMKKMGIRSGMLITGEAVGHSGLQKKEKNTGNEHEMLITVEEVGHGCPSDRGWKWQ
eukprot:1156305-Pelagomonas_calceolata.AAC.9